MKKTIISLTLVVLLQTVLFAQGFYFEVWPNIGLWSRDKGDHIRNSFGFQSKTGLALSNELTIWSLNLDYQRFNEEVYGVKRTTTEWFLAPSFIIYPHSVYQLSISPGLVWGNFDNGNWSEGYGGARCNLTILKDIGNKHGILIGLRLVWEIMDEMSPQGEATSLTSSFIFRYRFNSLRKSNNRNELRDVRSSDRNRGAGASSGTPVLGEPDELQLELNKLPTVYIAGNTIQLKFGGDTWFGLRNGNNFLAGSFEMTETENGGIITLTQTHLHVSRTVSGREMGSWVRTHAPSVTLEYTLSPPSLIIR